MLKSLTFAAFLAAQPVVAALPVITEDREWRTTCSFSGFPEVQISHASKQRGGQSDFARYWESHQPLKTSARLSVEWDIDSGQPSLRRVGLAVPYRLLKDRAAVAFGQERSARLVDEKGQSIPINFTPTETGEEQIMSIERGDYPRVEKMLIQARTVELRMYPSFPSKWTPETKHIEAVPIDVGRFQTSLKLIEGAGWACREQ